MKSIKVYVDKDMFPNERAYKAFVNSEDGWDWQYNITKNKFGYGDDGRDWWNAGDEWIDASEMLEIVENKDGSYTIYYEEE